jgi:hypothetical protein
MKEEYLSPHIELRRLIWAGPLTVLLSATVVHLVRFVAVALLHPEPTFMPLTVLPPTVDTVVFVTLAVFVFRRVVSGRGLPGPLWGLLGGRFFILEPIRAYRAIALRVLLVSFLPDIGLALLHHAAWAYAFALMSMHVAAWAVCVSMLTRLTTSAPQPEIGGKPVQTSENAALSIYNNRLSDRHRSLNEFMRCARVAGYLRGVTGILIPATLWLAFVQQLVSVWVAAIPAAAFLALHKYYEDTYVHLNRSKRGIEFYEWGIARIEDRWAGMGIAGERFIDENHLYTNDLDIFGKSSLFELLCTARTRSGQETLARWLCEPATRSEIVERQEAIDELRNKVDLREELAAFGSKWTVIDFDLATEWALRPPVLHSEVARIVAPFLIVFTFATLAYSFWFHGNPLWSGFAVVVQLAFGLVYRKRASDVNWDIHEPARELSLLRTPLARLEREAFSSTKLRRLRAALQANGKPASEQVRWLVGLNEMLDYRRNSSVGPFLFVLLWSTQVAFAIEAWRRRHKLALRNWIDAAGEFEALCALAGYAFEHPKHPFAEILEREVRLDGKGLRHPLHPESQCIPNSISLGSEIQLLMVSGSNMSGKSTLLRTIGVNLVLAQAGAPVSAQQLKCSLMAIGATLRVQDSLQSGKSRFYAEIRRLKDIMALAEEGVPILFLLDEILNGTNSHDRLIGAEAVIQGLVERKAIGLVTTHDLALTRVADSLVPFAANVHFEDHLENGGMVFDYRLRDGVIHKSNALELMRAVGLKV